MFLSSINPIKGFSYSDLMILFIFAFGTVFGSAITILSCLLGIICIIILFFRRVSIVPFELKIIAWVYSLYIGYFLLNGSFNSGVNNAFLSMAPNLPILCFIPICLAINWQNTNINLHLVSSLSTFGVLLSVGLACYLYLFPLDFELNGKTVAEYTKIYGRLSLFSGNPLPFSSMLVALSFFGIIGYSKKTILFRILTWVAIVSTALVIIFWSQSRGAQLQFLILLVISLIILWQDIVARNFKTNLIMLSILLVTLAFFTYSFNWENWLYLIESNSSLKRIYLGYHQIFSENDQTHYSDDSVKTRIELYSTALRTFFDQPFFGFGHDRIYFEVQNRNDFFSNRSYTHLHNSLLNHLIAGGLVGLFIFLVFLFLPILIIFFSKEKNSENITFGVIIFCYSILAGMTNLYLWHDLLASFHGVLPIILALSILGDRKSSIR